MTPEDRQQRKTENIIRFAESFGRPLSHAPEGETPAAARVRLLQDTLRRLELCRLAGLRSLVGSPYAFEQFVGDITTQLQTAQRELHWETVYHVSPRPSA